MVIDAISEYYMTSNANSHGQFITTKETDVMVDGVREKVAEFLGAQGPQCISMGANMTTLNYSLSKAIGQVLQPGDEILITQLDHEANRSPWLALRSRGIVVREVALLKEGVLDYADFRNKINERTRLVAMGYASNILGTVNDVKHIRQLTYEVGAWLLIDAVHYAPHLTLDVTEIGCDFLLCSVYKFYGPHIGILYAKEGLLDSLPVDRLRVAPQSAPGSIETGTPNFAAYAGVGAAIDFIASLGDGTTYRQKILSGMSHIRQRERSCFSQLYEGLMKMPKITVYGPKDIDVRAPTVSFAVQGHTAEQVCKYLASHNICAWDGHFYAIKSTEVLGLLERGGLTRMGMSVYTTVEEVNYTLSILSNLVQAS
jgi:cysteine desulfurase family protein (TIGR01976 family)